MTGDEVDSPSCWAVLGLTEDADIRAVKRRYAMLLRETRPDEDQQGFQKLRTAYEAALEKLRTNSLSISVRPVERDTMGGLEHAPDCEILDWSDEALSASNGFDCREQAQRIVAELLPDHPAEALAESQRMHCRHAFERLLANYCLKGMPQWQVLSAWGAKVLGWFDLVQNSEMSKILGLLR